MSDNLPKPNTAEIDWLVSDDYGNIREGELRALVDWAKSYGKECYAAGVQAERARIPTVAKPAALRELAAALAEAHPLIYGAEIAARMAVAAEVLGRFADLGEVLGNPQT